MNCEQITFHIDNITNLDAPRRKKYLRHDYWKRCIPIISNCHFMGCLLSIGRSSWIVAVYDLPYKYQSRLAFSQSSRVYILDRAQVSSKLQSIYGLFGRIIYRMMLCSLRLNPISCSIRKSLKIPVMFQWIYPKITCVSKSI